MNQRFQVRYEMDIVDKQIDAVTRGVLGLDHEMLTYPYAGREFRLTDVAGEVAWD